MDSKSYNTLIIVILIIILFIIFFIIFKLITGKERCVANPLAYAEGESNKNNPDKDIHCGCWKGDIIPEGIRLLDSDIDSWVVNTTE